MEIEKVRGIIAEQLGIDSESITEESRFTDDLGADSLDLFQIIAELEDAYQIEFDSEASDKIKTVGDAVSYIQNANR